MDTRALIAVAALATLLASPVVARAQDVSSQIPAASRYRYRLLGVYDKDTGDPVEGVEIIDVLSGTKTVTGKSGVVSLFFLPEGGGLVRVRKLGYELVTMPVSISPADTLPVTVAIGHATQLATVVVNDSAPAVRPISGNLRDFEERAKSGIGHFITTPELRKNDDLSLARLVPSHISGVTSIPKSKNGGEYYLVSNRKECEGLTFLSKCGGIAGGVCPVVVFLDGVELPNPVDADALRVSDLAGVEFYAGGASLPIKYTRTNGSGCGVLLLWSRER